MARKQSFNAPKLTAELSDADDKINPLLDAAGITTIKIKGEDVPAAQTRLPDRIQAYADVAKAGAKSEDDVNLATLCGQVTAQLEKSEAALAVAQANIASLTQDKSKLTSDLSVAQASVSKLTAEVAQEANLKDNATKLAGTVAAEKNGINSEISRLALSFNCLTDLRDKDGNLLSSKATPVEREQAADLIPPKDKLVSLGAICTNALQRLGVPSGNTPAQAPAGATGSKAKLSHAEFHKLDAKAQTAFLAAPHEFTD